MKRLFSLFALVAVLAIGSLFLNVPQPSAMPSGVTVQAAASQATPQALAEMPVVAGLGAMALLAVLGAAFLRDHASNISPIQCLKPASRSTVGTGAAIDLQGFSGATVIFDVGTWAAGTYTCTVQESDTTTDGDFTDVADADLIGTEPVIDGAADDEQQYKVGYKGTKRYIRGKIIGSGSPLTAVVSSIGVIRHQPHQNTSV